ncbi:hypothetical protein [Echinicola vietnamensis]|uniref:Nuclease-like protein n=1 Tax=Echinicola vietnamensis (strain DSM 17526 / LMG 23754 / KMM 6221) TaxID=926556 RepID=L0FWG0_ECHVK|nr:hypothetical protein [Echinicola vietnamensis]AGA78239.1 hypothetical protein Echvi_1986 [Echinicola vietnamensis DSM 17526]
MARVKIDGNLILTYEYEPYREIYWTNLSNYIIKKYGNKEFTEHSLVETILLDCFHFFVNEFKSIIFEESTTSFFNYAFYLHEQSLQFLVKTRDGLSFGEIDENDFSIYRRILKLALEQGCDIDLNWGKFPTSQEVFRMEDKIQRLFYLGTWFYIFADYVAFHKMIPNAKKINFDREGYIGVYWQKHYESSYDGLFPKLSNDYAKGTFDENAVGELKEAINKCFEIDFDFAGDLIFEIKKHFSSSPFQTIEPYVLPENLSNHFKIDKKSAKQFYNGLSISRENKQPIENVVYKPYSTERYMYRPILIYKIDGVNRALVGKEKFAESIYVLATNAISWNTIPIEWRQNKCMFKYMSRKGNEHDSILEDKVEEILKARDLRYVRNVKSFKRPGINNINIDNEVAGEIDFIIIDDSRSKIIVADSKYNKAKYEAVGFRTDNTNFITKYEPKLQKKIDWISGNKVVVQEHFKIIYHIHDLDISNYEVIGLFFINTPTFYMLNGTYKAITLNQLDNFFSEDYEEITIKHTDKEGVESLIKHPYFK